MHLPSVTVQAATPSSCPIFGGPVNHNQENDTSAKKQLASEHLTAAAHHLLATSTTPGNVGIHSRLLIYASLSQPIIFMPRAPEGGTFICPRHDAQTESNKVKRATHPQPLFESAGRKFTSQAAGASPGATPATNDLNGPGLPDRFRFGAARLGSRNPLEDCTKDELPRHQSF
jgi:hypothetical protein